MINDLGFNEEYINPIKEGIKTSTICRHFNAKRGYKIQSLEKENEQLRKELNDCEKFRYTVLKRIEELSNAKLVIE